MIASLLIANRGEIACRIMRTARRMGIRVVAVYSDADVAALHVQQADFAVHIGAAPARDSYLNGARIIEAALVAGVEAIHPGYGFLSENAEFAEAVTTAGLVWVGPSPASICAMGRKDAAKQLMQEAGVPVTPGYFGADQSLERLQREADAIFYPVLIKAVAGGGGKGMRKVERAADFADALQSCRREAGAAFGDDRVLIEKYIDCPRHIEVQLFGDQSGNIVHLFERDCSIQRRHQKIIEEAPAPGMDEATRAWLCSTAVNAARAVNYVGAGTIEFIADGSEGLRPDRIWFMEMNTRLQVEHPVTEAITGQDLVEWQLRVASGEALPKTQAQLSINGHAIEARLYAEDPSNGFLPSIGKLEHFILPADGIRVDSGVTQGSNISQFYDPMIAKIIAWSSDRRGADALLCNAMRKIEIWPVKTNAAFLAQILDDRVFVDGGIDTGFITRHQIELTPPSEPDDGFLTIAAQAIAEALAKNTFAVWRNLGSFRLNRSAENPTLKLLCNGKIYDAALRSLPPNKNYSLHRRGAGVLVSAGGQSFFFEPHRAGGNTHQAADSDGAITSPIPGFIVAVEVGFGDHVVKGQRLAVLSAMKMELALTAPFDGTVAELNAVTGTNVAEGVVLLKIERSR